MGDKSTVWAKGYSAGYAAAMEQAARIADGHRAMHLNAGDTNSGIACSSVAAFIVEAAREKGLWREELKEPLVLSDAERAALNPGGANLEGSDQ